MRGYFSDGSDDIKNRADWAKKSWFAGCRFSLQYVNGVTYGNEIRCIAADTTIFKEDDDMSTVAPIGANPVNETQEMSSTQKKSKVGGWTVGEPQLSEEGQKYYEQLKKKYSNMDFVLVSKDKKEEAQAQAGRYANANRMVVLIDEEKIERMAVDAEYRKQYEGIISGAKTQLEQLKQSLGKSGANVKTFGMKVNDNGAASFFAVMNKSFDRQSTILKKNAAKKAEKKKADQKAAEKKEAQRAAEERRSGRTQRGEKSGQERWKQEIDDTEDITITASSIDELLKKINDQNYAYMSDNVWSDGEKMFGQHVDYRS